MSHWFERHRKEVTFGQWLADRVAACMGSWSFLIIQTFILSIWIIDNAVSAHPWDAYPFILMNLVLSTQAAYAAPVIMISQNRQAERDRHQAEEDYRVNREAERRIEALQTHLALIEIQKIDSLHMSMDLILKHLGIENGQGNSDQQGVQQAPR